MEQELWKRIRIALLSLIFPVLLGGFLFWPLLSLGLESISGDEGALSLEQYRSGHGLGSGFRV